MAAIVDRGIVLLQFGPAISDRGYRLRTDSFAAVPQNDLLRVNRSRRESDVPDISLTTGIKDIDHVLVLCLFIGAQDDGLIWKLSDDLFEYGAQFVVIDLTAVKDDATILLYVENDFAWKTLGFFALLRGGHSHIELGLVTGHIPGQQEESQQEEDHVDHRRELERHRLIVCSTAKIHE